jgi:hypothetical protein
MLPVGIMREPDILDPEIGLLRLPFLLPGEVGLLQKLAELCMLQPVP